MINNNEKVRCNIFKCDKLQSFYTYLNKVFITDYEILKEPGIKFKNNGNVTYYDGKFIIKYWYVSGEKNDS